MTQYKLRKERLVTPGDEDFRKCDRSDIKYQPRYRPAPKKPKQSVKNYKTDAFTKEF